MASKDGGGPLPKFGEWDVNNPASAEGFTVIFNKARDERKTSSGGTGGSSVKLSTPRRKDGGYNKTGSCQFPRKRKWLCFG